MCKCYPGQASALSVIASSLLLTCAQAAPAGMDGTPTIDWLRLLPREGRTLGAKLDWRF